MNNQLQNAALHTRCADSIQREINSLLGMKLRNRLRSPQMVEDVRQETFLRVFALLRRDHGVRRSVSSVETEDSNFV